MPGMGLWLRPTVGLVVCGLVLASWPAMAETYAFDKTQTNITFTWDHLGLSRQSGRVLDFDGILEFDPGKPEASAVQVVMKASSLWTGYEALDRHLQTVDFFDVGRHPTITFASTGVKKTGERTGDVTGNLTILGIAKPVTLHVTWNFTGEHPLGKLNPLFRDKIVSGFTATARIQRSEWGMKRATPLTSDEIEIVINTALLKK